MSKQLDKIQLNPNYVAVLNKYDDSKRFRFKIERRLPDSKAVGVIQVRANDWIEAVEDAKKYDLIILVAAFGAKKGNQLFGLTEYKIA